jgi:hypothetical protein
MGKKLTTSEFIQRSTVLHSNKYEYGEVIYTKMQCKVIIGCPTHGEFTQVAQEHLAGSGCPKCGTALRNKKISEHPTRGLKISQAKLTASSESKSTTSQRRQQTLRERYGVDNAAKVEWFAEKLNIAFSKRDEFGITIQAKAKAKAEATMIQRYGVDNMFKDGAFIQAKFLDKYGVSNPAHVPEMVQRSINTSYKSKSYTMPSGAIIKVQGYEPIVIDWLLANGIDELDILTDRGQMPAIWYLGEDGQNHRYYPDIYVQSSNHLYEVKSEYTYTAGLNKNTLKKNASIQAGFKYSFIICNKTSIIDVR